jgi:hypothetical protein
MHYFENFMSDNNGNRLDRIEAILELLLKDKKLLSEDRKLSSEDKKHLSEDKNYLNKDLPN